MELETPLALIVAFFGVMVLAVYLSLRTRKVRQEGDAAGHWHVTIKNHRLDNPEQIVDTFDLDEEEVEAVRKMTREEFDDEAAAFGFFAVWEAIDTESLPGPAESVMVSVSVRTNDNETFAPSVFYLDIEDDRVVGLRPHP